MSRLEELIAELCPLGVKSIPMGSLMTRVNERGKDAPNVKKVYTVSNTLGMVSAEEYRENTVYSEDTSNYIVVREGMVVYNPSRLNIGSIAMLKSSIPGLVSPVYIVFSIDEEKVSRKYFEYLMHSPYVANKINSFKKEGARFRFDYSRWNWILVQIPPKQIQEKIVKILDSFGELTAKLTAELTARQKQYKYYASLLLSGAGNRYPLVELGTVATFIYGYPDKAQDAGDVRFIRITDILDNGTLNPIDAKYVSLSPESEKYLLKAGDIVMARTGTTYGKTLYIPDDTPSVFASFLIKIQFDNSKLLNRFYWHFAQSSLYQEQAKKLVSTGGQPQFNAGAISKVKVPIPSIEDQKKIIQVLDKFDAIGSSISNGLPAEIAARQKQYEYYRDKLMAFKSLES